MSSFVSTTNGTRASAGTATLALTANANDVVLLGVAVLDSAAQTLPTVNKPTTDTFTLLDSLVYNFGTRLDVYYMECLDGSYTAVNISIPMSAAGAAIMDVYRGVNLTGGAIDAHGFDDTNARQVNLVSTTAHALAVGFGLGVSGIDAAAGPGFIETSNIPFATTCHLTGEYRATQGDPAGTTIVTDFLGTAGTAIEMVAVLLAGSTVAPPTSSRRATVSLIA